MDESEIQTYFVDQVHGLVERAAANHEGFVYYFGVHEPRDEEILALLAVSPIIPMKPDIEEAFPTTVEALAALSSACRQEICREFRNALKSCLHPIGAA